MKRTLILLTSLLLTSRAAVHGQPPHPPVVDISGETERHVIIAQGTETDWQGHPQQDMVPVATVASKQHGGTAHHRMDRTHFDPGGARFRRQTQAPDVV